MIVRDLIFGIVVLIFGFIVLNFFLDLTHTRKKIDKAKKRNRQ